MAYILDYLLFHAIVNCLIAYHGFMTYIFWPYNLIGWLLLVGGNDLYLNVTFNFCWPFWCIDRKGEMVSVNGINECWIWIRRIE